MQFQKIKNGIIGLFAVTLFLQMFAINVQGKFGIAIAFLFIIAMTGYYFFRNPKFFYNEFLNPAKKEVRTTAYYIIAFVLVLILNFLGKEVATSAYVLRVFKYLYTLVLVILTVILFSRFIEVKQTLKIITFVFFIGCFYGIYQLIAPYFHFPYFLNAFYTNPSYTIRHLYDYYGGWSGAGVNRIFGVFSEPSFYGDFLGFLLIYLISEDMGRKKKAWYIGLILLNIVLTFARESWLLVLFVIFNWVIYRYFSRLKGKQRSGAFLVYLIAVPVGLYLVNLFSYHFLFKDASMSGRFLSQQYYLNYYLKSGNILHYLFGFGASSISSMFAGHYVMGQLEPYAHNGFIQVLFEFGFFGLIVFFAPLYYLFKKKQSILTFNISLACAFIFTFGEMYMVESNIIMVVLLYVYAYRVYRADRKTSLS